MHLFPGFDGKTIGKSIVNTSKTDFSSWENLGKPPINEGFNGKPPVNEGFNRKNIFELRIFQWGQTKIPSK